MSTGDESVAMYIFDTTSNKNAFSIAEFWKTRQAYNFKNIKYIYEPTITKCVQSHLIYIRKIRL